MYSVYNLSEDSVQALMATCLHYLEFAYFSPTSDSDGIFWDYRREDVMDVIKIMEKARLITHVSLPIATVRKCVDAAGTPLGSSYKLTEEGKALLENYWKRVGYSHK